MTAELQLQSSSQRVWITLVVIVLTLIGPPPLISQQSQQSGTSEDQFHRHSGVKRILDLSRNTRSRILSSISRGDLIYAGSGAISWSCPPKVDCSGPAALSHSGTKIAFFGIKHGPPSITISIYNIESQSQEDLFEVRHPGVLAWSPDDQQIAFLQNGDIYVLSLTTRKAKQVTYRPIKVGGLLYSIDDNWSPLSWSPDSTALLFEVAHEESTNRPGIHTWEKAVAVQDLKTQSMRLLDKGQLPSWSPGGDIVYVDKSRTKTYSIHKDGKDKWLLFSTPRVGLFRGHIELWHPLVWSPDGKSVVLQDFVEESCVMDAYTFNLSNGKRTKLFRDCIDIIDWR